MPKIKNIIIFISIAAVLVLIYIFFVKSSPNEQVNLVSSPSSTIPTSANGTPLNVGTTDGTSAVARDFLTLLLNVKNIKLNDAIFSDPVFNNLHDSSITLTPDGTEGRPNPFAQFGNDVIPPPPSTPNTTENSQAPAGPSLTN